MGTEDLGTDVGVVGGNWPELGVGHQLGEDEGALESCWGAHTDTGTLLPSLTQQGLDAEGRGVFEDEVTLLQHPDS